MQEEIYESKDNKNTPVVNMNQILNGTSNHSNIYYPGQLGSPNMSNYNNFNNLPLNNGY
jgi:hypothetical protein